MNKRYNNYPNNYNNENNNIYRSQDIPRSRSNNKYIGMRRLTPYNGGYNDNNNNDKLYNYTLNNRNNNNNYDDGTNGDFRNNRMKVFSPQNNNNKNINFNEDSKEKSDYVRRGYYNSQLNFPFDRYED